MTLARRTSLKRGTVSLRRSRMAPARKQIRVEVDPELVEWGNQVRERDGGRCQWPSCAFCSNAALASNDAHHKALRSARPDLRLMLDNGVTVCRLRHNWIHSRAGRQEAIAAGFLNLETYEAAAKRL